MSVQTRQQKDHSDIQAESLAADGIEVRQFREDVIRELGAIFAYRFGDFCTKLVLDILVPGE